MAEKYIAALFAIALALGIGCVVGISMAAAELCAHNIISFC